MSSIEGYLCTKFFSPIFITAAQFYGFMRSTFRVSNLISLLVTQIANAEKVDIGLLQPNVAIAEIGILKETIFA